MFREMRRKEKQLSVEATIEAGKKYIQTAADKTKVFKIKIEHMAGKQTK
jgi:hypothetical protein